MEPEMVSLPELSFCCTFLRLMKNRDQNSSPFGVLLESLLNYYSGDENQHHPF